MEAFGEEPGTLWQGYGIVSNVMVRVEISGRAVSILTTVHAAFHVVLSSRRYPPIVVTGHSTSSHQRGFQGQSGGLGGGVSPPGPR